MPATPRKKRQVALEDSEDESGLGSGYESSDSELVYVFQNLTLVDLRNGKRINWTDQAKTLVLQHAATHNYSARNLPAVTIFLHLAQLLNVPFYLGKTAAKACLDKLASLITRLVSASTLRPALTEVSLANGLWQCSWATWAHEAFNAPDFAAAKVREAGWLEMQHQAAAASGAATLYADTPARKSLSATALARAAVSQLVATKAVSKAANWLAHVPSALQTGGASGFVGAVASAGPVGGVSGVPVGISTAAVPAAASAVVPGIVPTITPGAIPAAMPRVPPETIIPRPVPGDNQTATQIPYMTPDATPFAHQKAFVKQATTSLQKLPSSTPTPMAAIQNKARLIMMYALERLAIQAEKVGLEPREQLLVQELYANTQSHLSSSEQDHVSALLECCRKHTSMRPMIMQWSSKPMAALP